MTSTSLIFRFFRSIMLFANFWHQICNVLKKKLHSRSICSISPWKNWMRADIRRKKTANIGITKASSPLGLQMWVWRQRCRFCGARIQNRSSKQYMLPVVPPRLTPVTEKIANMTNKMIKYMSSIFFECVNFTIFSSFLFQFSTFQQI